MILTTDFASLTDDIQSIFNEIAKDKIAELKGFKLFNVFDTNRKTYDHLILHGVEGIRKVAEGADLPRVDAQEGDTITYTQSYYGAIVPITKAMRKFDLHNQIESVVKSISADAFDKIDQSLADVLIHGFKKILAVTKSLLINGELLKKIKTTLTKQAKKIAMQVQRLNEETVIMTEAIVRPCG